MILSNIFEKNGNTKISLQYCTNVVKFLLFSFFLGKYLEPLIIWFIRLISLPMELPKHFLTTLKFISSNLAHFFVFKE